MLPTFAGQGFQESDQVLLVSICQFQRLQPCIEMRVLDTALVVMPYDFFQSLETAIVHIRAGMLDLTQRWRLERAFVLVAIADIVAAEVWFRFVHANADVDIGTIGKVESQVTTVASGFLETAYNPQSSLEF